MLFGTVFSVAVCEEAGPVVRPFSFSKSQFDRAKQRRATRVTEPKTSLLLPDPIKMGIRPQKDTSVNHCRRRHHHAFEQILRELLK